MSSRFAALPPRKLENLRRSSLHLYRVKFWAFPAGAVVVCAAVAGAAPTVPQSSRVSAYELLARSGNVRAQATLGRLYLNGVGIELDEARAFYWLHRAALGGDLESQPVVADLYREGRGVQRDYAQAARWYAAAEDRDPYAAWRLGRMLESGEAGPNYTLAAELYAKAARRGFAAAQNSLGNLYLSGVGVALNYGKALKLYRAAAAQGYAEAELNLAGMYFQGVGVAQDYRTAYQWAQRALSHHARDAQAFLIEIRKGLSARAAK